MPVTTVSRRYGAAASPAPAGPVVLMVSGGADSTALLVRACTSVLDLADGRGPARVARERLHVLHVNYGTRGADSDADEAFVRELADRMGVPMRVERTSPELLGAGNFEDAARRFRYGAARRWAAELCSAYGVPRASARICTAHTASDRAETFLMNAVRGSGAQGLAAIPRRRNAVVRPLLDETHEDLCRYLEVRGIGWCEDASNLDTSYLRNFVRHRVMPLVLERNPRAERALGATCDILGDEDAFLSGMAQRALREALRAEDPGSVVLDAGRLAAADVALARRVVRLACSRLARSAGLEVRLESSHVEAVLECLAAGRGSVTLPAGVDARVEFGALALRSAQAREEIASAWLPLPGRLRLGGHVLEGSVARIPPGVDAAALVRGAQTAVGPDEAARTAFLDMAALGFAEADAVRLAESGDGLPAEALRARLWVDGPRPGDLMCPLGMGGRSKKVSDVLGEARVPVPDRPRVRVVRTGPGGSVVWVAGIRPDERFKCLPTTRVLVKLRFRRVAAGPGA